MSVSEELKKVLDTNYDAGNYVICVCSNATFLACKPLPGDMVKCVCGNDYLKAVAARVKLNAEYEEKETEAINEKKKLDVDKKGTIPDKAPPGISQAVHKTFKNVVLPAFLDADGKSEWDVDELGENPMEAMKIYDEFYTNMDKADKTKYFDAFRKENTAAKVIEKLVEVVKVLGELANSAEEK